nr:DUF1819 family protein [Neobacillus sp. Marseille-Q6967]
MSKLYTTQLQAGLGLIEETKLLFSIWEEGMTTSDLYQKALNSGYFPNVSARRLRNIVAECFAPRFLTNGDFPALLIKKLIYSLSTTELNQILFLYTSRANKIFADYVIQVYWDYYSSGHESISTEVAKEFVIRANEEGKTANYWSETTIRRIAAYLNGCCGDFGLLESGRKSNRKIRGFRIEPKIIAFLAYDLHFSGFGDNAVISHSDWAMFGLQKDDVRDELKRLSLKGYFIIQSAGDITHLSWNFKTWEELLDVIIKD